MTGTFNCSITWKDGGGMKQDFDRSSKKERGSNFSWNEVCRSFAAEAIRGGLVWGRKAEICSFRCLPTKVQGREHFGDRPGFSAQAQLCWRFKIFWFVEMDSFRPSLVGDTISFPCRGTESRIIMTERSCFWTFYIFRSRLWRRCRRWTQWGKAERAWEEQEPW